MPETAELLHLDNIFIPANQAIGFEGNGLDEQIAFLPIRSLTYSTNTTIK